MAETNTRQASRAPVTLKIKFKSETLHDFIERYSVDISQGGIFIRTQKPLAVGTALKFEFQLKDATPLIAGEATVVWTREHDPDRSGVSPGMGVRFDSLPPDSQKMLDQVLAKKDGNPFSDADDDEDEEESEGFGDDFVDTPTRVAPAALVDTLISAHTMASKASNATNPVAQFGADLSDFSDEDFSEATRVASLDSLLAQEKTDANKAAEETPEKAEDTAPQRDRSQSPSAATPGPDAEESFGSLNDDDDDDNDNDNDNDNEATDGGNEKDASDRGADDNADKEERAPVADVVPAPAFEPMESEAASPPQKEEKAAGDNISSAEEAEPALPQEEKAVAVVAKSVDESESGSSMPWIAVAAVIMIIGSIGGFWLLRDKNKDATPASQSKTTPVPARAEAPPAKPATGKANVKVPSATALAAETVIPQKPEKATVSVSIESTPEGATVSVQGSSVQSKTPAVLDLLKDKKTILTISHNDFLTQTIEVVADGSEVPLVALVAKPRVLHLASKPTGAIIFLNGRRLAASTPLVLPLSAKLASLNKLDLQFRMPRYKTWKISVPTGEGFVAKEKSMVRSIRADLVALPAARPRRPQRQKPPAAVNTEGALTPTTVDTTNNTDAQPAPTALPSSTGTPVTLAPVAPVAKKKQPSP